MPPVMDTSIKVDTRTYGKDDHKLPAMGPRIDLNGAPAFQEWDEVTGKVMREIRGNLFYSQIGSMTSYISGDLDESIGGNHTYVLEGNLTHTVLQTVTSTTFGAYMQLNGSTRTETFTGAVTRQYQAKLTEHHPESWLQDFTDCFHFYVFRLQGYGIAKVDLATFALSVNGGKLDLNMWKGDISVFRMDTKNIDVKISNIKTKIHTMAVKLLLTGALIAALYFGTPFKPNALPTPTILTPLE
jgi:hypothetical protein